MQNKISIKKSISPECITLDLRSLESVREFEEFKRTTTQLFHLECGYVTPSGLDRTQAGFELQFGTNHLRHFNYVADSMTGQEDA
jgi:hypothetical protein